MTRFEIVNKHLMVDDSESAAYIFFIRRDHGVEIDKFYCLGIDDNGGFHAECFKHGKWHNLSQQMANILAMISFPIVPTLSMYPTWERRRGKI